MVVWKYVLDWRCYLLTCVFLSPFFVENDICFVWKLADFGLGRHSGQRRELLTPTVVTLWYNACCWIGSLQYWFDYSCLLSGIERLNCCSAMRGNVINHIECSASHSSNVCFVIVMVLASTCGRSAASSANCCFTRHCCLVKQSSSSWDWCALCSEHQTRFVNACSHVLLLLLTPFIVASVCGLVCRACPTRACSLRIQSHASITCACDCLVSGASDCLHETMKQS